MVAETAVRCCGKSLSVKFDFEVGHIVSAVVVGHTHTERNLQVACDCDFDCDGRVCSKTSEACTATEVVVPVFRQVSLGLSYCGKVGANFDVAVVYAFRFDIACAVFGKSDLCIAELFGFFLGVNVKGETVDVDAVRLEGDCQHVVAFGKFNCAEAYFAPTPVVVACVVTEFAFGGCDKSLVVKHYDNVSHIEFAVVEGHTHTKRNLCVIGKFEADVEGCACNKAFQAYTATEIVVPTFGKGALVVTHSNVVG